MDRDAVTRNLRSARKGLNKSQAAIAKEIGVATGTYSAWERWGRLPRCSERMKKLAEVLSLEFYQLTEDRSTNLVAGLFSTSIYRNENVEHVGTTEVKLYIRYKNGILVTTGMVAEKPDGTFGIIIELKDAKFEKYFIGIWWPNSEPYPKWYSLNKLKEQNIKIDDRILSDS